MKRQKEIRKIAKKTDREHVSKISDKQDFMCLTGKHKLTSSSTITLKTVYDSWKDTNISIPNKTITLNIKSSDKNQPSTSETRINNQKSFDFQYMIPFADYPYLLLQSDKTSVLTLNNDQRQTLYFQDGFDDYMCLNYPEILETSCYYCLFFERLASMLIFGVRLPIYCNHFKAYECIFKEDKDAQFPHRHCFQNHRKIGNISTCDEKLRIFTPSCKILTELTSFSKTFAHQTCPHLKRSMQKLLEILHEIIKPDNDDDDDVQERTNLNKALPQQIIFKWITEVSKESHLNTFIMYRIEKLIDTFNTLINRR